ncbi:MAG: hypothetical protein PUC65_09340 [Clostridiales bacterium]|nr:hypothetical protein [Clostridiales bacterium]
MLTQLIIVSIVLYASLKNIGYPDPPLIWRKSIIWNTLYGFISYLMICGLFLLAHFVPEETSAGAWILEHIAIPLDTNPFSSAISILYVLICLLLCGLTVYFANRHLSFRKTDLTDEQKHKVSLCLAVFSAPFIALFPSVSFYR